MAIDAFKALTDLAVDHRLARVNVGAQVVARDARRRFRQQHVLGGQLLRLVEPSPDGRLGNSQSVGHSLLALEVVACRP